MAYRYRSYPSRFGDILLIWQKEDEPNPLVRRVLLPSDQELTDLLLRTVYAGAAPGDCPGIAALVDDMDRYLHGEPVTFSPDQLALEDCLPFQRLALLAEHAIPRGRVSTYGTLAKRIGHPGAARAVGTALARNPFPILIPCHRAVRSDGHLGGFAGGLEMKRALLALEGVRLDDEGRVLPEFIDR
jgi:methylated-DNA-[protein]-cysteine S-methyltransferase